MSLPNTSPAMAQTESFGFPSADVNASTHKEDPQWAVTRSGKMEEFTAPKKNISLAALKENSGAQKISPEDNSIKTPGV